MKIVIIGASGTVGRAVTETLSRKHEVIRVGRTQGDYQVDITSQESVEALFEKSRSGRCDRFRHRQSILWTAVDNDRPGL
ncbi:dTDP-4-dehydrorhamnose reductase [Citrobacter freundii ATCC 8090 = MTCC 1658 = NBRC 12681]|nr:dTDP-4-dehydrorhamnose reductase [Citrobacter freundii ATCC 8090 = MTCC 1658 = NBRC 12681]